MWGGLRQVISKRRTKKTATCEQEGFCSLCKPRMRNASRVGGERGFGSEKRLCGFARWLRSLAALVAPPPRKLDLFL